MNQGWSQVPPYRDCFCWTEVIWQVPRPRTADVSSTETDSSSCRVGGWCEIQNCRWGTGWLSEPEPPETQTDNCCPESEEFVTCWRHGTGSGCWSPDTGGGSWSVPGGKSLTNPRRYTSAVCHRASDDRRRWRALWPEPWSCASTPCRLFVGGWSRDCHWLWSNLSWTRRSFVIHYSLKFSQQVSECPEFQSRHLLATIHGKILKIFKSTKIFWFKYGSLPLDVEGEGGDISMSMDSPLHRDKFDLGVKSLVSTISDSGSDTWSCGRRGVRMPSMAGTDTGP